MSDTAKMRTTEMMLLMGMMIMVHFTQMQAQAVSETIKHMRDRENLGKPPLTTGYIPTCKSGVTISSGIDLGQQTEAGLKAKGVPQAIIDKLKPYLGLKTKCQVKKAGMKAEDLKLTDAEALALEKIFVEEIEAIVAPYSTNMGAKGKAALTSLRHWAGALGNTKDENGKGKLAKTDKNGKVVNHVWNAIKNKNATLADLKKALEDTLKLHKKGTAAYNRIQHEINYIK